MADQVSSLSIQITSDASNAVKAVESLRKALSGLNETLGSIDNSGISATASALQGLTTSASAFKNLGLNKSTFSGFANGLNAVAAIDSSKLSQVSIVLETLAQSISGIHFNESAVKAIAALSKAFWQLGRINLEKVSANIDGFIPELQRLQGALDGLKVDQEKIKYLRDLANAISRLGSEKIQTATSSLGSLGEQLSAFFSQLTGIGEINGSLIGAADAFGNLGNGLGSLLSGLGSIGGAQQGISGFLGAIAQLGAGIAELASGVLTLHGILNIAQGGFNAVRIPASALAKVIAKLASVTWNAIKAFGAFVKSHIPGLGNAAASATPKVQSLGFALWKLYAQLLLFRRIMGALSKPVEISSGLTEIQNVVDHTFGKLQYKLNDFTKTSIKDYGLSELSAKKFASRYQAMGMAMGITNDMVKQASGNMESMGRSSDLSETSLADMSITLTKLTGDLASFYDQDQAEVAEKLNSVFTGMARPLRAYGIDLTQATLQEWALKNGIDANVQSMTQAEKTMLRYQYVLANTKNITNDFQRTSDTWANQIRQLKQNFEVLGAKIGTPIIQALKPVIKAINVAIQAVINFAQVISDALGFIFGWHYEKGGGAADLTADLEGAADAAGGLEDSTGGAADNAKKMKSYLMGIDELNVIEPDTGSGGGGGGGGGGGASGGGDADGGGWTQDEQSGFTRRLSEIGSLFDLGRTISNALSDAMESIPWQKIYNKASNFGKGLAEFLNGLITPRLFANIGRTVANALNTALHFLDSFGEYFKWDNFGNSLKAGFMAFFANLDWSTAFSAASNFGTGLATALNSFITPELFTGLGRTIGAAINVALTFLRDLGQTLDFTQMGESLKAGITSALSTIDWVKAFEVLNTWGTGLAEFLNSLLTPETFASIATTLANILNGVFGFLNSFGTTFDWTEFGNSIATGIETFFQTFNPEMAGESLNGIIMGILTALKTAIEQTDWKEVGTKVAEFIKALDPGEISGAFGDLLKAGVDAGLTALSAYFSQINWSQIVSDLTSSILGMTASFNWMFVVGNWLIGLAVSLPGALITTILGALSGMAQWISDTFAGIGLEAPAGLFKGISEGLVGISEWIRIHITDPIVNFVKEHLGIHSPSTVFSEIGNNVVEGLIQGIKDWLENIPAAIEEFAGKVLSGAQEFFADPLAKLKEIGGNIVSNFNSGVTENSGTSETPISGWASNITTWFSKIGGGSQGINQTTFSGYAKDAVGGFNTSVGAEYTNSQAPIQTWGKGIITWFTGDGAGEDKINKVAFEKFAHDVITAFGESITTYHEETKEPFDTWVKGILAWFTGETGDDDGFVTKTTWTKFAETIVTAFKDTIVEKYQDTKECMETWAKNLVTWFYGDESPSAENGLGKKFYDNGVYVMEGLINGLKSRLADLREVCSEISDALDDTFEDKEEIGSPSKKWGRYGGWIIEGLTNEMDRNLNHVVASATSVTDAIDSAYKPYMPTYGSVGYSVPNAGGKIDSDGIASGMSAMITSAVNGSSDTALMQQQNEILTRIANKNSNVYMDGKKTDALLKQAQKRKGFTFRPRLGNA